MGCPGIGLTSASCRAYRTQNGVMKPRTSAGSSHSGGSVTYNAQRISPSGFDCPAALPNTPSTSKTATRRAQPRATLCVRFMNGLRLLEDRAGRRHHWPAGSLCQEAGLDPCWSCNNHGVGNRRFRSGWALCFPDFLRRQVEMPLKYHIDSEGRMLFIVGEGVITQEERLEVMRAWLRDPAYRPGLNTLCDFSATTSTPKLMELKEIIAVIRRNADLIGRKKVALVAAGPATYAVARQFRAFVDPCPLDVNVFKDRQTAMAWLRGEEAE